MTRPLCIGFAAILAAAAASTFWAKPHDYGNPRFFVDQTYDFQTLRVLNDTVAAGGDTGEALQSIVGLKSGDGQGWCTSGILSSAERSQTPGDLEGQS